MSPPTRNSCAKVRRSRISCGPTGSSSAPRASMPAPCCAKDCQALVRTAEEAETPLAIIDTVLRVNEARKRRMAKRITAACGGTVEGKTLAALGLTFKPNTDDMRDSPSLAFLPALREAGATIRAFD